MERSNRNRAIVPLTDLMVISQEDGSPFVWVPVPLGSPIVGDIVDRSANQVILTRTVENGARQTMIFDPATIIITDADTEGQRLLLAS